MIIAIGNRKGGSAKTTSAVFMALCFREKGKTVICLDADEEISLIKWQRAAQLDLNTKQVTTSTLIEEAKQANETYDYVIIDLPPNDEAILLKASGVANEVIVPVQDSHVDIGRLGSTLETVNSIEEMRNKNLLSVVLVRVQKNTTVLKQAINVLKENKIPVCDTYIYERTFYKREATPTSKHLENYRQLIAELEL